MLIDPAEAPASLEQEGGTLYFCSRGCRDEFLVGAGTPKGYSVVPTAKEAKQ
jgi:YHS domain-containing protein